MTLKTLLAAGAAAALLAGPVLAAAQTQPNNGRVQRETSRQDRAATTNPNNTQGRTNANSNAGFGAGGQTGGGQNGGGQTGGGLQQGMPVVDASGKVIGTIVQVQRTRDGEIRQVKVRFDGFGRVMVKLVPNFQLKVQGKRALTDLVREQIERLQDA